MKKISTLLILVFCFANLLFSQNVVREVGLYTTDLNNFGFRFKAGTEDLLFRFTVASLNLSNAEYEFNNQNTKDEDEFGIELACGIEAPVPLTDRFDFFYGGEIAFRHTDEDLVDEDSSSELKFTSYGAGMVLGFSYHLSSRVRLSAEIVPDINFVNIKQGDTKISGWKFEANSRSAGLTLSYRF